MRDRSISHSRSKFNSTSINMTLISRTDGDFQSVHKALNKQDGGSGDQSTEQNGGGSVSRDEEKALVSEKSEDDSFQNNSPPSEKDPLNT